MAPHHSFGVEVADVVNEAPRRQPRVAAEVASRIHGGERDGVAEAEGLGGRERLAGQERHAAASWVRVEGLGFRV